MTDNDKCPIWGTDAQTSTDRNRSGKNVISPRAAGNYFLDHSANNMIRENDDTLKARITTWLINQREIGVEWPEIFYDRIEQIRREKPLPVHERGNRLLKYLGDKTSIIGSPVEAKLTDQDNVVMEMKAWSESLSVKELIYLGNYLVEQGWVDKFRNDRGDILTTISVRGYARLDELATKQISSSQGFVAMWFPDKKNKDYKLIHDVWIKGIYPGIEQARYKPYRVDRDEHNDQITDKIIAEIRRSKFLVADFTHGDSGVRGGVYYEAGFALGLNIPVIYTCLKERFGADRIHFDIQQQNFILWENPEDLREKLKNRITGSAIGWGPNAPSAKE